MQDRDLFDVFDADPYWDALEQQTKFVLCANIKTRGFSLSDLRWWPNGLPYVVLECSRYRAKQIVKHYAPNYDGVCFCDDVITLEPNFFGFKKLHMNWGDHYLT